MTAVLPGRDSEHLAVVAEIHVTALAMDAFAAEHRGIEGDAVAELPVADAFAQGDDFTRGLMAHDDGLLSVAYGNLVGVLIEAVKDLAEKVERLEART